MADQPKQTQDLCVALLRRFAALRTTRGIWENHWDEIAARVLPGYWHTFKARQMFTPGEKRTQEMFDATASLALEKFAAAMESMLTPRSQLWHRLTPTDKSLMRNRDVRLWLDNLNDLLFQFRYSPKANYASQQHEVYKSLGAFGTGTLFIDGRPEGGTRYRSIHLGETYGVENHEGTIDTVYRWFRWSARKIVTKWGMDSVPKKITEVLENKPDQEFDLVHVVLPRENWNRQLLGAKGMKYASYYMLMNENWLLSEGGYRCFPYAMSRYTVSPGEDYGRSPAMLALPAIKVLNEEKKTVLKAGHRAVDPVLLAHDDGVVDSFSLRPGAINAGGVTPDGKPLIHALQTGNFDIAHKLMEDERAVINDAFLVTLFQILIETPQMTATEVLERAREKGALLSPTMGRQQSENLGPTITREIDILVSQGRIAQPPYALVEAGLEYDIEYDSPLSRAQKAEQAAGFTRTMQIAMEHAQATGSPEALDWLDVDAAMPEIADINATPVRWVRSPDAVAGVRAQRQQNAQVQQAIEASPAVAGAVKALQPTSGGK